LLSSADQEGPRGIVLARQGAERVAKPVRAWRSDQQEAFVKAIATECPGMPHRSCHHHFRRDVATPVLDMARQAQVTMRRTVRGWRAIERRVWAERRQAVAPQASLPPASPQSAATPNAAAPAAATPANAATPEPGASSAGGVVGTERALEAMGVAPAAAPEGEDEAGEGVRGYGAAVRGMLHESQGGPLHPPGVRMSEALQEGRDALQHNLEANKGGRPSPCGRRWPAVATAAWRSYRRP
jgi:pyruvate/2-oxoglutarate dehydrogenase complex dihydrolipoamide acyltransferase (E2) component